MAATTTAPARPRASSVKARGEVARPPPTGEGHEDLVSVTWNEAPETPADVHAALVLSDSFDLGDRDHTNILVELIRSLPKRKCFTITAWEQLATQFTALITRWSSPEEISNYQRVIKTFVLTARRSQHRRSAVKRDGVRYVGFTARVQVSDAFADFARDQGAGWSRGEHHSRCKCSTVLYYYLREARLWEKQGVRIDDKLRTLLPPAAEGTEPRAYVQPMELQSLLSRHVGQRIVEPTSCEGELPNEEDTDELPPQFAKRTVPPGPSVTFNQFTRVSSAFHERIIAALKLTGPSWAPTAPHSRAKCVKLLETYCENRGLVEQVEPAEPAAPPAEDAAAAPAAAAKPAKPTRAFIADAPIAELFEMVNSPVQQGARLTRLDFKRLVFRHVGAEPLAPSACPPHAECPVNVDTTPISVLPEPKKRTTAARK